MGWWKAWAFVVVMCELLAAKALPWVESAETAPRPKLQILNASQQPIEVFWLKSETERVSNGLVPSNDQTIITTTLGHRFVIVGRGDKSETPVASEVLIQGVRFDPPSPTGVPSFYTQAVSANGFPIVASADVNPFALKEAAFLVNQMLAKRPDVREAMIKSGSRLCLLAHDEFTTDLPEFSHLGKGRPPRGASSHMSAKDYWDARARGTGGSQTDPFCSCGEENLLGYPGDPYAAECILIHELAHNIHLRGMGNVDPTFDRRVKQAYDAAMKAGLWQGKYASVNHHEYFAEGAQSWFDDNRENDHDHNHVNTRAELLEYDPGLAALCREVFGDTEWKYSKPATRLKDHLEGYGRATAPKFRWPDGLASAKTAIRDRAQARERTARFGEDWPRWRGPRGDGSWRGPALPEKWPEDGLKPKWKIEIGGGYSGVTAVGSQVFVMDHQKGSKREGDVAEKPELERVLCLDADSGRIVWTHEYPVEYGKLDYGTGPRAAPTVHDGKLYSVGALGELRCLNAATGEKFWAVNYVSDLKGRLPTWGFAGSAFIDGDRVFVQPGGENGASVAAIDRLTGKTIWSSLDDEAGYATPMIAEHNGHRQLILWTPSHIRGLNPVDGQSNWAVPYKVTYGVAIAQPIFEQGHVIVCGYWEGSKAIRLGELPSVAELAWEENKFLRGLMSQPLYRDGHVYLLDKQYGLTCFELTTSKKLWDDKNAMTPRGRNPQASLIWLEQPTASGQYERTDRALILNSDGDLILARLNPSGYEEQSRANIIGPTWAHPAIAGRHVFARSDTELVCVELLRP